MATPNRTGRISAAIFLLLGIFALVLGALDSINGVDVFRLFGLVLVAAGITMVVAAVVIFSPRWSAAHGRHFAFAAAAAGLTVGVSLLLLQIQYRPDWRIALWVGLILASLVGLAARPTEPEVQHVEGSTEVASEPSPASHLTLKLSSYGVSLGFLLTLFQVGHAAYAPIAAAPILTVSTQLQEPAATSTSGMLLATVTIKNISDERSQVVSAIYQATGLHIHMTSPDATFSTLPLHSQDLDHTDVYRYATTTAEPLQFGQLLGNDWYFDPKEEYATTFPVAIPHSAGFDAVRLSVDLVVARGSRVRITGNRPLDLDPPDSEGQISELQAPSTTLQMVGGSREILVYLHQEDPVPANVASDPAIQTSCVEPANTSNPCPQSGSDLKADNRFQGLYDLGDVSSQYILPLH